MRSFWKGAIGFGLVSIPVKAYKATEEHGLGLHQVHAVDGGRIRLSRYCELDGAEVPAAEVGRAADTGGGDVVLITEEDLATLPVPTLRTIGVHAFVPPEQIDALYLSRSYYLEPDTNGVRPYVLFAEALRRSGRVALVKVAFRQRESLAAVRVRDNVLVLETLVWPGEIRTPDFPFLDEDVDVRLPELKAATALIDCLAGDFDPGEHTDAYREALDELIEAKAAGNEVIRPEVPLQPNGSGDLLTALEASVKALDPKGSVRRAKAAAAKATTAATRAHQAARTATKSPR
ncbi:Ku protein [Kutzneria buriramensis]|uniref:Non-homologous end joining protein Ku n=1 Tax=Kutzneria buriramensis TaxID=1045776 RepID=A0A3E0HAZ6_9PSEU|nr:Ku protein [Kutzneria buriramensis]REH41058.1 DNA end-binding protein Ku [Kutzneria buriramensis]